MNTWIAATYNELETYFRSLQSLGDRDDDFFQSLQSLQHDESTQYEPVLTLANGYVLNRKSLKNLENIEHRDRLRHMSFREEFVHNPFILRRYYKSLCEICDVMEYSFNPERRTVCLKLLHLKKFILFLVEKRRKTKFNRCIVWLKHNITFSNYRTVVYEENWAKLINAFFGKMPWNIKHCVLKFLLEK